MSNLEPWKAMALAFLALATVVLATCLLTSGAPLVKSAQKLHSAAIAILCDDYGYKDGYADYSWWGSHVDYCIQDNGTLVRTDVISAIWDADMRARNGQ